MRKLRYAVIGGIALAISAGAVAQIHNTYASASHAATKTILAKEVGKNYVWSPKKATIKVGTKVTWKNPTDVAHNVNGQGSFHFSKSLPKGKSVSYTFKKAGTYKYTCTIHPATMKGTIIVKT